MIVPDKFTEIEKAANMPFDEWEEKRFELELAAKRSEFAEWMIYGGIKDRDFILRDIETLLQKGVDDYSDARMRDYLDSFESRNHDRKMLMEHVKTA